MRSAEEGAPVTCVDVNGEAVTTTTHVTGDVAFAGLDSEHDGDVRWHGRAARWASRSELCGHDGS